ncbi:hypothetical protein KBC03_00450 [Patescibacteria group bacterium]|nr:hypothetical protein [Patescibacteria group bacterium]
MLQADPERLREFKQTFKTFRDKEKERRLSVKRNDDRIEQGVYRSYYYRRLKKLLALNTPYSDTKYIKQLLYATESYCFLANEDLVDLINDYLYPLLQRSRQDLKSFLSRMLRTINNNLTLEGSRIYLSPESLISHDELFEAKSDDNDVKQLLKAMSIRDNLSKKDGLDYAAYDKGVVAEFIIRYLTQTSHFTYNIKKAIDHESEVSHRFYIGPDRIEMINKRMID